MSIFTALRWMTASWRVTRAEAAGVLLNNVKRTAGMAMTATAVASAMRIRTAPPFVGRENSRLALLGVGGLRPLHSRPERRAGRRGPFWLFAAGCAAGCVQPSIGSGCRPRFVVSRGACGQARRDLGQSEQIRSAICFLYAAGSLLTACIRKAELILRSVM